jgi:antirestriction protein ArdC
MALSTDICENITASIIRELDAGALPWVKPWRGDAGVAGNFPTLPRRHTGEAYRGINILLLWAASDRAGFKSNVWMTYKQAQEYKAFVRKGEKGTQIVYASKIVKPGDMTESGEQSADKVISFLKGYTVFNVDQIDGLPAKFAAAPHVRAADNGQNDDLPGIADWFSAVPAVLHHGGDRAYFSPHTDFVAMPVKAAFKSAQAYYGTLAHEFVHWTGHETRLNREFGKRFGDNAYAMEELVAELGAAFTMASLGLLPQVRDDHAPYIASWLKVLKADSRAIVTAAAKASDAVAYLEAFDRESVAIAA